MWDEISKIESVLVRVPHEDAREALRALDALQRALDEVHDAARPRIGAWHNGTVEAWARHIATLITLLRPSSPLAAKASGGAP